MRNTCQLALLAWGRDMASSGVVGFGGADGATAKLVFFEALAGVRPCPRAQAHKRTSTDRAAAQRTGGHGFFQHDWSYFDCSGPGLTPGLCKPTPLDCF